MVSLHSHRRPSALLAELNNMKTLQRTRRGHQQTADISQSWACMYVGGDTAKGKR